MTLPNYRNSSLKDRQQTNYSCRHPEAVNLSFDWIILAREEGYFDLGQREVFFSQRFPEPKKLGAGKMPGGAKGHK